MRKPIGSKWMYFWKRIVGQAGSVTQELYDGLNPMEREKI
jgi:hypothetical protein